MLEPRLLLGAVLGNVVHILIRSLREIEKIKDVKSFFDEERM
jgi:hypothetical protein